MNTKLTKNQMSKIEIENILSDNNILVEGITHEECSKYSVDDFFLKLNDNGKVFYFSIKLIDNKTDDVLEQVEEEIEEFRQSVINSRIDYDTYYELIQTQFYEMVNFINCDNVVFDIKISEKFTRDMIKKYKKVQDFLDNFNKLDLNDYLQKALDSAAEIQEYTRKTIEEIRQKKLKEGIA